MKVPKLDIAGSNWVIYKTRFSWAIDARGLLEHIDGSMWEPSKPSITTKKAKAVAGGSEEGANEGVSGVEEAEKLTEEDEKRLEEWKERLRIWKLGEAVVKQQIAATIPDSLFMKHTKFGKP
jgi:hypothetical protein